MEEQGKLWDDAQEPRADEEQEHATRESTLELLREVREQRKQLEGTGRYILLPTEALTVRAEAYYYKYVEDVAKMLVASGITQDETIQQVIQDYCFTLMGFTIWLPYP